jgi:hypothetical protein
MSENDTPEESKFQPAFTDKNCDEFWDDQESVNEVMAELEDFFSDTGGENENHGDNYDDDATDDEFADGPYERSVTIVFPAAAEEAFNIHALTLPIRDVLEIYTQKCPNAPWVNAIREGFYSGDDEEDHYRTTGMMMTCPATPEKRARARLALRKTAAEREARKTTIEAELIKDQRIMAPFHAEISIWESDDRLHQSHADALDLEWERYVIAADACHGAQSAHLECWRSDLVVRGDRLAEEGDALDLRWAELTKRAHARSSRSARSKID